MISKNEVQTEYGNFRVKCSHTQSNGKKVKLLARPVRADGEANAIRGVVTDVIFQQDRFKVTFDNGMYVFLTEAPKVGSQLSVQVKIECLA